MVCSTLRLLAAPQSFLRHLGVKLLPYQHGGSLLYPFWLDGVAIRQLLFKAESLTFM